MQLRPVVDKLPGGALTCEAALTWRVAVDLAALLGRAPHWSEQLDEIARHCGCLPLALRVAGSFLARQPNWPVDDYLKAL
jgi:hypothetical protein